MFHHEVSAEKSTNVRLVIHDSNDRFIPHSEAVELAGAWPDGRLITTTGLGHHRILRDPEVIDSAVAFISESTATTHMERRAS
jgi:pimeloyl-ACP methyl ester carboxylesterase